jgi:dipeptidyl-peptidase-4
MRLLIYLILMTLLLITPAAFGSTEADDIARAELFLPANVIPALYNISVNPNAIDGTDSFWYLKTGREGKQFVLVDVVNRTRQPAFNHAALAEALALASGSSVDPTDLPFSEMTIESGTARFSALNKTWTFDLQSSALTEIAPDREAGPGEDLSPNGEFALFVQDGDLWIRETTTDKRYPLTTDGFADYAYAKRSDTVSHPISQARLNETAKPYAVWSPDSRRIATFRMDQRNVTALHLLQYAPGNGSRPQVWEYRFAMPDDETVPIYEPLVVDLRERRAVHINCQPQPEVSLMDTEDDVLQWWSDDGETLYSLYSERGEKVLRLLKTDPENGKTEEILEEGGPTYVEANLDYASRPNAWVLGSGDVIWFSEKSGYGHLYLYGENGEEKNAITAGEWAVRTLLFVDEKRSQVYFTAGGREPGRDPYYRHLYRASLDGIDIELLTPEDADHNVQIAPGGTAFLDSYSRVDLPPVTVLRDRNGSVVMILEEGDTKNLTDMGWRPPEIFSVKSIDGDADLYGLIIKPTSFNASMKYPVVETVYPGPWTIVTAKSFPGEMTWVNKIFWRGQALAELGFVVVTLDGPGTPYRSKEFHDASYGRLGDAGGLADHVHALQLLAKERPYMDLDRGGIFGHSAGGFMTAQALLTYPDFYKVGVASSGDYDSRFYASFWGEKYEGLKPEYDEQITALKAENLTGDLLLVTGDVDDNVNPCMTMQLVDALMAADRSFDLLVMTNRNHDLSYDPYYIHRLFDYFTEHLQGAAQAPARFSGERSEAGT